MNTVNRAEITDLQQIPNIGPSIAANLRQLGISSPHELPGKDPYAMYDKLCRITGVRHDPCLLDVFIAATRFMAGDARGNAEALLRIKEEFGLKISFK
jgi:hypothetical protein